MPNMGHMALSPDANWPTAASLLSSQPREDRLNVALLGVHTFATSVTPRSSTSTPQAVRGALQRYSTWSYSDRIDLGEYLSLWDLGDVENPDGEGGLERVAQALGAVTTDLTLILGGDNAATWLALRAIGAEHLDQYGLVTLDAHLDLRDGVSNGSPVRQLIEDGLSGEAVVQVALADFSNSPFYARRASNEAIRAVTRDELRQMPIEEAARRAVERASGGNKKVYVDIDVDAADRSVVPGCPAAAPGGLSADEMRRFVREVASMPSVVAIDFTEVDVDRDENEVTVRLVALLVLEALAGFTRRKKV